MKVFQPVETCTPLEQAWEENPGEGFMFTVFTFSAFVVTSNFLVYY